jgi:serine/threonine-protein kinase
MLAMIGQHLGTYQVLAKLGEGGMGEVYRARDARLGRDVAIKILPRDWTRDADRLARLEREARALAALNHPNIATIHGIEDSEAGPALVLELVEGETLAQRIRRGPIPLREALPIARQVAEALEAAHEKGIVHRDLKPANVIITPAGSVKVLDFGLAKLDGGAPGTLSHSPTLTVAGTREGVIAGTAAYMSPEQARGLAVDKRTDIWAFGCLLFEMLTGRPPFTGETVSDIIVAILQQEPRLAALPADVPAPITRLIARALHKDQRLRWRDIGDVRFEIDTAFQTPPAPAAAGARTTALPWAIAAAAVIIALGVAGPWRSSRTPAVSSLRLSQATRVTHTAAQEFGPAMSPDGKWVAYYAYAGGRTDVWVKYLDGGAALNLTSALTLELPVRSGIGGLAISPDGRQIAFGARAQPGALPYDIWLIDAPLGGTPRRLLEGIPSVQWSPDGSQLAYTIPAGTRGDTLGVANADGTSQRVVVEHEGGRHIHWPAWSHDGRWIYFIYSYDTWHVEPAEIYRVAATGGTPEPVVRTTRRAVHPLSLPGGLLFAGNPSGLELGLWWLPDGAHEPLALTNGIGEHVEARLSPDGTRVVSSLIDVRQSLVAISTDPATASQRQLTNGFDGDLDPAISPIGDRLVFSSARSGHRNLWIANADATSPRPLTTEDAIDTRPIFSPDGRQVAFVSDRGGQRGIWLISAEGGAARLLAHAPVLDMLTWSRDGGRILFAHPAADLPALATVNVANGRIEPFTTAGGAFAPAWSPAGDLIAYLEPVTVAAPPPSTVTFARMYVRFVDPAGNRVHTDLPDSVNFANGFLAWAPDGRRIAVASVAANAVAQIWVVEPGVAQPFRKLIDLPVAVRPRGLTWTRDGKTVVFAAQETPSDIILYDLERD